MKKIHFSDDVMRSDSKCCLLEEYDLSSLVESTIL